MTAAGVSATAQQQRSKRAQGKSSNAKLKKFCCSQHLPHLPPLTVALGQSARQEVIHDPLHISV